MTAETTARSDSGVTCENCDACCCRLEVMLLTDTGVPEHFIETDRWGGMSMARLVRGTEPHESEMHDLRQAATGLP
jgi:hypothetical protein